MEKSWINLLEFLDFSGDDTLFEQRELLFHRIPFEMEKTLYQFIAEGKPTEMKAFYQKMILDIPSLKVVVGKTSHNRLKQLKYAAVSAVAIACRAAIWGGAIEARAYAKSDEVILTIDETANIADVLLIELRTLLEYAEMVRETKSMQNCSVAVRACIEYITVHTHEPISLEKLADGSSYTKEYLAKIFKKEIGISISDFILRTRVDEAKKLLISGVSCCDTAHILGFSPQSYFIRQFKKVTGMTPKTFITANA